MADPSTQWQQREGSGARYGADAGAGPSASGEPTSITGKHLRVRASNLLSSGATYLGTRNWEGLAAGAKARALELTERARGAAVGATADGQEARGGGGSGGDSEQEGRAYRPPRGDGTESGRGGRPSARKSLDSFRRLSTSTTSALSLRTRTTSENLGTEEIALLPGFALRKVARDRHPQTWGARDQPEDLDDGEVELYVPLRGFVSKRPEVASRSQRVFFQMAKQVSRPKCTVDVRAARSPTPHCRHS